MHIFGGGPNRPGGGGGGAGGKGGALPNVTERDYIVGLNYYILENRLKFQINYYRKTFNNGLVPSRNLFLANLQTAW